MEAALLQRFNARTSAEAGLLTIEEGNDSVKRNNGRVETNAGGHQDNETQKSFLKRLVIGGYTE